MIRVSGSLATGPGLGCLSVGDFQTGAVGFAVGAVRGVIVDRGLALPA